jgi:hypothetical protein
VILVPSASSNRGIIDEILEHGHRPFALMTALLAGVALSFIAFPLHLSAQEIQLESAVLWEEGIFTMTATVSLSEWPGGMPGARYQAEQYIRGCGKPCTGTRSRHSPSIPL